MLKRFLELVEIRTKVAGIIPFIWGSVYTGYYFHKLRIYPLIFFFISIFAFDMFTTALNNYQDWKKARKKQGFNYEKHNAIVRYGMAEGKVVALLILLFVIAVVFGLITFFNSDIVVLLLGVLSFLIGILYSAGPLPLSRTPLGEIFSGIFMGYILPFLAVYLSLCDMRPIIFKVSSDIFTITLNLQILFPITLILIPTTLLITNIMLANNICDTEDDIIDKRYTLPICMGRKKALVLFNLLYALCYSDIILCIILGFLPIFSLIVLIPSLIVVRNLKAFKLSQEKKKTFALSVLNFLFIMIPLIISILPGWIFNLQYWKH